MWGSVPVKTFIVRFLHIQRGIDNYALSNIIDLIDSDVENLSTDEEVDRNIIVKINQDIEKGGNTAKYVNSMIGLYCNTQLCR